MATNKLYFVPLSSITETPGQVGFFSSGTMFPDGLATGDTGNTFADDNGLFSSPASLQVTGPTGQIIVSDDDGTFDDDAGVNFDSSGYDSSTQIVTGGTTSYNGFPVQLQYGYIMQGSDGTMVTIYAVNFRDGAFDNTVEGIVSNKVLDPNVTYTVVQQFSLATPSYSSLAVCFANGTMIRTPGGEVAVEALNVGDMVMTKDRGAQPVRWIGARVLKETVLAETPALRPVRITAGALGDGLPAQDLTVSPQHRVLVRSKIAERMFGQAEVLVAAKQLLEIDGVEIAEEMEGVTYFHVLFDQHEVIWSNGAPTESLYTGEEAFKALSPEAQAEIMALFPELVAGEEAPQSARVMASGRRGRQLAKRHLSNGTPLVAPHAAAEINASA